MEKNIGLHIGAIVDEQCLELLTASILQILDARADQETIRAALDVIKHHTAVKNVTVQNCTISGGANHNNISDNPGLHQFEDETGQEGDF